MAQPRPRNNMNMPPGLSLQQDESAPWKRLGANQHGPSVKSIGKGSLIQFNYLFWIHDPSPLVIVTDIFASHIRGVNLHYLTFPFIRKLLQPNCNNTGFSFYNIKADQYIVNAFRTYKRQGVRRPRVFDCSFILNLLGSARALDPADVENLRKLVHQQIQQRSQVKADQMTDQYMNMVQPQQGFVNTNTTPPESQG